MQRGFYATQDSCLPRNALRVADMQSFGLCVGFLVRLSRLEARVLQTRNILCDSAQVGIIFAIHASSVEVLWGQVDLKGDVFAATLSVIPQPFPERMPKAWIIQVHVLGANVGVASWRSALYSGCKATRVISDVIQNAKARRSISCRDLTDVGDQLGIARIRQERAPDVVRTDLETIIALACHPFAHLIKTAETALARRLPVL